MAVAEYSKNTELVVIGAGPGGYTAALHAAALGQRVTLIESRSQLGGVCLLEGCIPSKTLLHAAEVIAHADHAADFGVTFGRPKIDLDALRRRKQEVVDTLVKGVTGLCKRAKVDIIHATARFDDAQTLRLSGADVARLSFNTCIIATGSTPMTIPTFDVASPRIMDSTAALELRELPKSLLVIGGGYIGLELGSVYAALGTTVTVVEMLDGLLPGADRDLVRPLAARLKNVFQAVHLNTRVTGLKEVKGGVEVTLEGPNATEAATFENVLISIGRRPNTNNLGLENTNIRPDKAGFIPVERDCRTVEPRIYAIGDVAGQPMLAHKAIRQARVATQTIAGEPTAFDNSAIPAVVFTDPEVAWAGLTETEAKAKSVPYVVKKLPWGASGRAATLGRQDGTTKIICDPPTHRVLGIGIVGPRAGDLISEGVLAIEKAASAEDLAALIHPHPTLSETIGDAAELFTSGDKKHRGRA